MQAAKFGITRPAKAQQMAEGGFVKALKDAVVNTITSQTPNDAPLGSGAAAQAKTALTTRRQTIDDAEKKAVGMAKGGAVRGKGTATSDDIPIMASNGEFMLKAAAVKKIGLPTLEALNAIADGDKKPAPRKKQRGAIRKMAVGGPIAPLTEEERRRAVAQIPTGGVPGAGPTPGDGRSVDSTEFGRNASNTINALGGVVPGLTAARGLMGATRLGSMAGAIGQTAAGAAKASAPYGVPLAGFSALNSASSPDTSTASAQPAPAQPAPAQPAGAIRRLATGAGAGQASPGLDDPRRVDRDPSRASLGGSRDFTNELGAVPQNLPGDLRQGVIHKTVGPNGNPVYSGVNVGANAQFVDGRGAGIRQGGTVSSIDTSQGHAQNLRELARIEADKEKLRVGLREQDLHNQMLAGNTTAARSIRGAIRRENDARTAGQQDATQRLAQDRFKLESDRFDLEKDGAKLDNASKEQLAGLRNTLFDENATPAQRKSALETYRALTGKSETPNRYTVVPGGQQIDPNSWQAFTLPSQVIDNQTGQFVQQQGQQGAQKQNFTQGQTYTDGQGRKAKWDGSKFVPL